MATPTWLSELQQKIAELETEATKFYEKGVKKSGGTSRKLLQDIKILAQTGRVAIQGDRVTAAPKKEAVAAKADKKAPTKKA